MAKLGVVTILSICVATIYCVVLIPERANVTKFSMKFATYGRAYITRVSRKSPYFFNMEGEIKHVWGNNITAALIFYEYLHNEYRRTFVEIHARLCDIIHKDHIIGTMLQKAGLCCPVPAGDYHLLNMTVPTETINFQLPFYKFRIEVTLTHTETKEWVASGYINAVFKDK